MEPWLILARTVHYAAMISLAGSFAFTVLILPRSLRAETGLRRRLTAIAWASLAAALLSGAVWLLLEARQMSGQPLLDVLDRGVIGTVLERTRFGRVWELRLVLAVLTAGCLFTAGRMGPRRARDVADRASLILSASSLSAVAWTGHAAAPSGVTGAIQLTADAAHLLAAGAWLGSLLPLALVLAAWGGDDLVSGQAAAMATRRFSILGIASVATLIATGVVNGWLLSGTLPALLGTTYGRLLLLKLGLFAAMIVIAAINRTRLTPRLSSIVERDGAAAARTLRRNALIEAGLGTLILMIVGALGTMPPGLHAQPSWPLPFRLSLEAPAELPDLRDEVIGTAALAVIGLFLMLWGAFMRPLRRWAILAGIVLFLGIGWRPVALLAVPAYPTSFYRSPVPLTAASVARGARVYAENCLACHGAGGRGDGEAASRLPLPPADLTAEHIFGHPDGDLFWWIRHGMDDGAMPGFAGNFDEPATWDLINFVHARAAGVEASDMSAEVTGFPSPVAPDFSPDLPNGASPSLSELTRRGPVLLVFFSLPQSLPRLEQLARWKAPLAGDGLTLIAVSAGDAAPAAEGETLPDFVADAAKDIPEVYALYESQGRQDQTPHPASHIEFLIDRSGYLRARWHPGDRPDWSDLAILRGQLARLAQLPMAPVVHTGHVH